LKLVESEFESNCALIGIILCDHNLFKCCVVQVEIFWSCKNCVGEVIGGLLKSSGYRMWFLDDKGKFKIKINDNEDEVLFERMI